MPKSKKGRAKHFRFLTEELLEGNVKFQSKAFLKLQKEWYVKLKKDGFEDVEHDEMNLRQYTGKTSDRDKEGRLHTFVETLPRVGDHPKYTYYSQCRDFLLRHEFKTKKEHRMFELHTDGVSIRDIAKELKTYRDKVHTTLNRLKKVMRGK